MKALYKPYVGKNVDKNEVMSIILDGRLYSGHYMSLFEERLKKTIGNDLTLAWNSYDTAYDSVLHQIDLKDSDEIILSPNACLASLQPFVRNACKIKWCDINPNTGSYNIEQLKDKITRNTKAIVVYHWSGVITEEFFEILALARLNGVYLIEDAIESFGSESKGLKSGNLGSDFTIFSFKSVRYPNAIDGAAISMNTNEDYNDLILRRDYGVNRENYRNSFGEINSNCDVSKIGYGALLNELNSYLGLMALEDFDYIIENQRKNALMWRNILKIMNIKFRELDYGNSIPNYWTMPLLFDNKEDTLKLFRKKGYYVSNPHIKCDHYSLFNDHIEDLSGASDFNSRILSFPTGWWINNLEYEFQL